MKKRSKPRTDKPTRILAQLARVGMSDGEHGEMWPMLAPRPIDQYSSLLDAGFREDLALAWSLTDSGPGARR